MTKTPHPAHNQSPRLSGLGYRFNRSQVLESSPHEFIARYKNSEIWIKRESKGCHHEWYIQVTAPCGRYSYDGWWGNLDNSINDAIHQALKGSCLLSVQGRHKNPS